jgi:hypothetical protein
LGGGAWRAGSASGAGGVDVLTGELKSVDNGAEDGGKIVVGVA